MSSSPPSSSTPQTRRHVLALAGRSAAGIAFVGSIPEIFAGTAAAAPRDSSGYGPLIPDPDGLLDLPRGFRYRVLSREGDPLRSGEGAVPGNHDGMTALPARRAGVRLVRNHENRPTNTRVPVPAVPGLTYDPAATGGCTALSLDRHNRVLDERVAIAGTAVNCAGGPTPWHTWLTCEETEDKAGTNGYTKDHGFIFEVDPADPHRSGAVPLTAMGRFPHEAVAVDPHTGAVYETEDASAPFGLFYRFLPDKPLGGAGSLRAGGRLEAMRVPGVPDLSAIQVPGTAFDRIEWLPVPDPLARQTPIRRQDFGPKPVTHAQKLEGCYWGHRAVYFVSSFATSAAGSTAAHYGQVWKYEPHHRRLTLVVVFGPDTDPQLPGESPDNICLTPNGGLMVCEDGNGAQHVFGVTRYGEVYPMARNRIDIGTGQDPEYGELAGVTFSPDRRTMYVNVYTPGTTFAVTGPWS
jgi:secreted PhoX family phosphatase